MNKHGLLNLSPLDGRYATKTKSLTGIGSEFGLIHYRVSIEISWFKYLSRRTDIPELPELSTTDSIALDTLDNEFDIDSALEIKSLEKTLQHDVKAVEYWLKDRCSTIPNLTPYIEFIHFACTSDDINNLAYGLMLKEARNTVLLPAMVKLVATMAKQAQQLAKHVMPARTHGQIASPTTMGKELANYVYRLRRQLQLFAKQPIYGKMNGSVGNYNAHLQAYPNVNWLHLSAEFITSLNLEFNPYTTQIEPHDSMVEYAQIISRFNQILLDFNRDIWSYIAIGYFTQSNTNKNQVGSSTMPHKINPIDFENSEGNLGIANTIAGHFANKLPVSRWQRDLSDSTTIRNISLLFAHSLIAWQGTLQGLQKLKSEPAVMQHDLNSAWETLAEPIQTIMRKHRLNNPYEQLRKLTQGRSFTEKTFSNMTKNLNLPEAVYQEIKNLTPASYTGLAVDLALQIAKKDDFRVAEVTWGSEQNNLQKIRHQVFVREQAVPPEDEWDGMDQTARHFLVWLADLPLGTGRLQADGKIGRMAVLAPWRNFGLGSRILKLAVKVCIDHGKPPFLSAQLTAERFYLNHGFVRTGEEFMESGIAHVKMIYSANQ